MHKAEAEETHDGLLLRGYLERGDQAAFARLAGRYLGLVYSACLRETGSPPQAEDAAQAVFLLLARKAPSLTARASLAGWLFSAARLISRNARRQEKRRQGQEQKAAEEMIRAGRDAVADDAAWAGVAPALNDALAALSGREREAVLLSFFQGLSLTKTGDMLGISADAAQMRVSRALEKLRRHLAKTGVGVSGAALAVLLPAHAAHGLPAGGAAGVVAAPSFSTPGALGAAGSNAYGLCQGAEKAMWMTRVKITATLAASLGLAGTIPLLAHVRQQSVHGRHGGAPVVRQTPPAGVAPAAAIDPRARQLLDQMVAAYPLLHSYSDTTEFRIANGSAASAALNASSPPQLRASVSLQRPNRAAVKATTFNIYYPNMRREQCICDGKTCSETRYDGTYLTQSAPPAPIRYAFAAVGPIHSLLLPQLLTGPIALADTLKNVVSIKREKVKMVGGIPVETVVVLHTLVGMAVVGADVPLLYQPRQVFAIGVKDHLLRRCTVEGIVVGSGPTHISTGALLSRQIEMHRDIRVNPALPASTWTFTPPLGFTHADASAPPRPLALPPAPSALRR